MPDSSSPRIVEGPGLPTILDSVESSLQSDVDLPVRIPPAAPPLLTHSARHACWQHDRNRVYAALQAAGVSQARLASFAHCGCGHWIIQSRTDPTLIRLTADNCHDRWCVPCARLRSATLRVNLASHISPTPHRLLTLTVRHNDQPLADQLDALRDAFSNLRRTKIWKSKVLGGIAFLEIGYNRSSKTWHPHLHAILEGSFLPVVPLRAAWSRETAGSMILHITLIRDHNRAVDYVAKYATKPYSAKLIRDPVLLSILVSAMHNRRTHLCFGTWSNWKLVTPPPNSGWHILYHSRRLPELIANGDPLAQAIVDALPNIDPDSQSLRIPPEFAHPPPITFEPDPYNPPHPLLAQYMAEHPELFPLSV